MIDKIAEWFLKLLHYFPFELKRHNVDRNSPYYCDSCRKMSMTLIHTGIKHKRLIQDTSNYEDFYHGLYYCSCGKMRAERLAPQKISPSIKHIKLVKELKELKVIVEQPEGIVTYYPEAYQTHQK